ncbi:hypothetical protein FQN55_003314 [Onygenales sp. PD_40]|nr:hypothetical protein FQN55_003314 [Onygenales sp. PD_40]
MDCEILIIGAGIFGTSTAYHLSQTHPDPSRVTILDVAPYPPPRAASTDTSKIIRTDYTNLFYMEMAYEAMDAWANWPIFANAGVFHRTGWVVFDSKEKDRSSRIRKCFRASSRDDVTMDFTWDDVKAKWPAELGQVDGEGLEPSYSSPSPAWADAGDSIRLMLDEAVHCGVKYEVGEVSRLVPGQDGIESVETREGKVYRAKKVLLATGAWTSQLMSPLEDELEFAEKQRVETQVTAEAVPIVQFKLTEEEIEKYSKLPIVVYGSEGQLLPPTKYGTAKFNTTAFSNTVITKTGHKITAPPTQDQSIVPENLKEKALNQIKMRLPQMFENGRQPHSWRACWESVCPDKNQLMTRHPNPKLSNLYFAVGGSFHSWKFLPTIGKYVVNVLEGIGNSEDRDRRWGWKDYEEAVLPAVAKDKAE